MVLAVSVADVMMPPVLDTVVSEDWEEILVYPGGREAGSVWSTAPGGSTSGVPSSVVRMLPSAGLIKFPSAFVTRPAGTESTVPSAVV